MQQEMQCGTAKGGWAPRSRLAALSARHARSSRRCSAGWLPSETAGRCTICTAQLAPDDDGRALEDTSAVVKAELRVVFDALRCARPGSALVPGPLAASCREADSLADRSADVSAVEQTSSRTTARSLPSCTPGTPALRCRSCAMYVLTCGGAKETVSREEMEMEHDRDSYSYSWL